MPINVNAWRVSTVNTMLIEGQYCQCYVHGWSTDNTMLINVNAWRVSTVNTMLMEG